MFSNENENETKNDKTKKRGPRGKFSRSVMFYRGLRTARRTSKKKEQGAQHSSASVWIKRMVGRLASSACVQKQGGPIGSARTKTRKNRTDHMLLLSSAPAWTVPAGFVRLLQIL
jgi:hypothetical protein